MKICPVCKKEFQPIPPQRKYCKPKCAKIKQREMSLRAYHSNGRRYVKEPANYPKLRTPDGLITIPFDPTKDHERFEAFKAEHLKDN